MGGVVPGPSGLNPSAAPLGAGATQVTLPGTSGLVASGGPRLLLIGQPAMAAVASILPTAHRLMVSTSMGEIELRPGSVWSGNRMLVYAAPLYVYYTIDDRLYEWTTGSFVREEWLNALSRGAKRAEWLVAVAKFEMALIVGILVPWYVLLGVSCAKLSIFYAEHKQQVDKSWVQGKRVLELLQKLRREHPTLFDKLLRQAAKDLIENLPEGVTGEDVGFFLGRVIKGVGGLPELTIGAVTKVVLVVATLVTASHLPAVTAHAVEQAAKQHGGELEARLREAGYTVTRGEAESILRDALSKPDVEQTMQELQVAAKELVPSLQVLNKALIPTK